MQDLGKRKKVLNQHLNCVSNWLEEEGISKNSNLGKEFLKQTKELIENNYEVRELKELKTNISKGELKVENILDLTMKVNCKNKEEAKLIEKEIRNFTRRIKHIRTKGSRGQFNYETSVVNLENGKIKKTIINKR